MSEEKPKETSFKCRNCGEPLEPNTDKCPKCGSKDRDIAIEDSGIGQEVAFRVAFVDTIRNLYDSAPKEKKEEMKEALKKSLEDVCRQTSDAKVGRWLEPPSMGVIDITNPSFAEMLSESFMCYVDGYFFATISVCGITAERLCMDILLRHKLTIDGRILSPDDIKFLFAIPHSNMIDLLYGWNIINADIKGRLYRINQIRNTYVHPDIIPEGELKKDSLEILTTLKYILNQLFPRSSDMPQKS